MNVRRLVLPVLAGFLLFWAPARAEEKPIVAAKTASQQIQERKQQALAPTHRESLQRRTSSQERFERSNLYQFTDPDGSPTFTNLPKKYKGKRGYVEVEIKYEPIVVPQKYARRAFSKPKRVYPSEPVVSYSATEYDEIITDACDRYGVDKNLVCAVIRAESAFNPNAVSSAGACGLMQLMPGTAAEMGVTSIFDPAQNIEGGTQYLAQMMSIFGDVPLALAAYNAGPERVREYRGIPPYAETKAYVNTVLNRWQRMQKGYTLTQLIAEANGRIPRTSYRPMMPVAKAKQFMVHFHSGLTQPADKVSDKDPYYVIEYNKRLYTVRKDLVARIAEPV